MAGQLQTHFDSCATPNQPSPIAGSACTHIAESFDLDPLFLEESWTLGIPAAVASQRRRRQLKADREDQARTSRALGNVGTARFLEDRQGTAEAALTDRAATIVDHYDAISSQSWVPQDWAPEDQIAHSGIPQGWMPDYMPRLAGSQQAGRCTDPNDRSMTAQRARLLLEVTPESTREQIRSAYRRMVGQWHPDRLQFTTEAIREHATRHMAALNEAYRLLGATALEEAA